jgi:hypothetical protein
LNKVKNFYWDDPYLFKFCPNQIFWRCIFDNEVSSVIKFCHSEACGGHFLSKKTTEKIIQSGFYWPTMFKDTHVFCKACENCQKPGFISKHKESLNNLLLTFEMYPGADCIVQFMIYNPIFIKNILVIVLGIWLKKTMFANF